MKKAFTLAEVLITLGIIGVVAALVMPSLIANYRKKQYVVQLQKAVSVWDNAMKLMLATDGVEYFNDTEFAKAVVDTGVTSYSGSIADSSEAANILKKYLNIVKFPSDDDIYNFNCLYDRNEPDGTIWPIFMADGSAYSVNISSLNLPPVENLSNGVVTIDVNGKKGPNQNGRDVFGFYMDRYGQLIPTNSMQAVNYGWMSSAYYWRNQTGWCGIPGSSDTTDVVGNGCAARIMENGWVMDY